MRSTPCLAAMAALTLATSAAAWEVPALDAPLARSAGLLTDHRASPVVPRVRISGSSDLVLNGLILVGTGLVAGAAGFALMAACPEGSGCYSRTLNTVAWVLAAPGILPIVVGAFMIYLGMPNRHASLLPAGAGRRWSLVLAPLAGGGAVGALGRF